MRRTAAALSVLTLTGSLLVFDVVALPGGAGEEQSAPVVRTLSISAAGEVVDEAGDTLAPSAAPSEAAAVAPSAAPAAETSPAVTPAPSAASVPAASAAPSTASTVPPSAVASQAVEPVDAVSPGAALLSPGSVAAVTTEEIGTETFSVLGVTWDETPGDAQSVTVEVQVRDAEGEWSGWTVLEANDSSPDPGTEEYEQAAHINATEPFVAPDADGVQVRVRTSDGVAPQGLEAVLIDPGETASAEVTSDSSPLAEAGAAVRAPGIISREQWGAISPRCRASYSDTVLAATVHHTAGTNNYTAGQSAGLMRGIQSYHQGTLGWCDVGYNFVVDKYGQVFEGRAGGVDRPVNGAHAGGFNATTFGVSALGDYQAAQATPALVDGISRVIGWKLSLYGRDTDATVRLTSAGGGTARFSSGTSVTLPTVFGHRDVGLTACPGQNLYNALSGIRRTAKAYQAANDDGQYGDLYAVSAGGASGKVEMHADSRSSSFRNRMLSVASGLAGQNPGQWRFFVGSFLGDTRPDLIAVRTSGASSGKVEVHVYSWASRYSRRTVLSTTPMDEFTADERFQLDIATDAQGRADLVLIDTKGAGGTMDVHALSAASRYKDFSLHKSTPFGTGYGPGEVKLMMDDERDLWMVKHGGVTGTGKMELHVVSAASDYQKFTLHRGVPAELGPLTKWAFTTGDYTGDGLQDLYLLKVDQGGSGRSEVHVLSGSSQHRTFVLHRATSLPKLPYPLWQVSIG